MLLVHPNLEPKTFHKCPPNLPIRGISPPLQVNSHVLPLKPSKLFLFVSLLSAHEEVVESSLFTHARQALPLTSMHNVLVLNIAKRAGKRVPSPQKYKNNKNK